MIIALVVNDEKESTKYALDLLSNNFSNLKKSNQDLAIKFLAAIANNDGNALREVAPSLDSKDFESSEIQEENELSEASSAYNVILTIIPLQDEIVEGFTISPDQNLQKLLQLIVACVVNKKETEAGRLFSLLGDHINDLVSHKQMAVDFLLACEEGDHRKMIEIALKN